MGVELDFYTLNPEKGWEINLDSLESQIKPNTKAILVNNPSNPCGSCFTKEHMMEILAVADKHRVPIISDEVYYDLSYDESRPFISMGELSENVPVICTGALSKIYCVPGWRCGWTIVYNKHGYFDKVIDNLGKHSMIPLHPNTLVQAALPKILEDDPEMAAWQADLKLKLKTSAEAGYARISQIKGMKPVKPSAAMYMMVGIYLTAFKDIKDDVDFCKQLLQEQNCLTFPSQCFFSENAFRVIICTTPQILNDFGDRLQAFCDKHYK